MGDVPCGFNYAYLVFRNAGSAYHSTDESGENQNSHVSRRRVCVLKMEGKAELTQKLRYLMTSGRMSRPANASNQDSTDLAIFELVQ